MTPEQLEASSSAPSAATILMAWANYHLSKAGLRTPVTNLSSSWSNLQGNILRDLLLYYDTHVTSVLPTLLHQLEPDTFDSPAKLKVKPIDEQADIVSKKLKNTFGFTVEAKVISFGDWSNKC